MRRQYRMAFGGWLTATAVALGQTPPQQPAATQPVRYVTPFGTSLVDANSMRPGTTMQYVAVQQSASGNAQSPITVQYVPMQAMGNGQYMAVQPNTNVSVVPQGYVAVQPMASGAMANAPAMTAATTVSEPPAMMNVVPATTTMHAANAPTTMNTAAPMNAVAPTSATSVQYVPVQPMSSQPNGLMTSSPMIQYVPVQPISAQAQGNQAKPAAPAAATQQQPAATQQGQGCANGNCGQSSCNACQAPTCQTSCQQPCGPYGRVWVSAEYLLWWTDGMNVPPLVTASPAGTPRAQAGVLGQPNTTVLYGGDDINSDLRSGFRIRFGGWLDNCQTCGLEASYFFLGDANDGFSAGPSSTTIIGRPFQNINLGNPPPEDSQIINDPNQESGNVTVNSSTGFSGFDANIRKNCKCDCCSRTDWLVGFRYLKLDDELTIDEDITITGTSSGIPVGTRFQINDSFKTRNEFYGAQVGLAGDIRRGQYFMQWRTLVALGTTHQEVTIGGQTIITPPGGASTTYPGGVLALPTNMGKYSRNQFSYVPELGVNLGYVFSEHLRVFGGYSLIYWSDVVRAGDAIDTVINPTQFPPGTLQGPARPAFTWNDTDFWAQGFSFGAELRY